MNAYRTTCIIFLASSAAACGGGEFRLSPGLLDDAGATTTDVDGESPAEDGGRLPDNAAPGPADSSPADGSSGVEASGDVLGDGGAPSDGAHADELAASVDAGRDVATEAAPLPCAFTCSGCCDSYGRCQPGTDPTFCGGGGQGCVQCLAFVQSCGSTQVCTNVRDP